MTTLNVPEWAFILIWLTLMVLSFGVGWFMRGLWDNDGKSPDKTQQPKDDFWKQAR